MKWPGSDCGMRRRLRIASANRKARPYGIFGSARPNQCRDLEDRTMIRNHATAIRLLCYVGVVAMTAAIVCGARPASAQDNDVKRAAELAARWRRNAHQRFATERAWTSEQTGEMLELFIVGGAARAVRESATGEQLSEADTGIDRFAAAMVKAGTRQPDGTTRLGEDSFVAAKSSICPLYPFC